MPKRQPDHIPSRTCAVCRTSHPKREMTRIVRRADGSIIRDESGREPGRGTYICQDAACREPQAAATGIKRALGADPAPGALEFEVNHAAK